MESELLGIAFKHSKPNHPQTWGKVERFHRTEKKHLGALKSARTLAVLQGHLDDFAEYSNEVGPHRSLGRRTPQAAFGARRKARPSGKPLKIPPHCRVRQDKVNGGNVTLRDKSTLYHVGVGRRLNGHAVLILVKDLDVRILTPEGVLIRQLRLDPKRIHQPHGGCRLVHDVSRDLSTMSRDTTWRPRQDSNLRHRLRRPIQIVQTVQLIVRDSFE